MAHNSEHFGFPKFGFPPIIVFPVFPRQSCFPHEHFWGRVPVCSPGCIFPVGAGVSTIRVYFLLSFVHAVVFNFPSTTDDHKFTIVVL